MSCLSAPRQIKGPSKKNVFATAGEYTINTPRQVMPHEYKKRRSSNLAIPTANRRVQVPVDGESHGDFRLKRNQKNSSESKRAEMYFRAFDYDQSGSLDVLELENILTEMKIELQPGNLEEILNNYWARGDVNNDGTIDLEEFKYLYRIIMSNQPKGVRKYYMKSARLTVHDIHQTERVLRNVYQKADLDGSGTLENKECTHLFREAGFKDIHRDNFQTMANTYFRDADTNSDGMLDFHEFVQYSNRLINEVGQGDFLKNASSRSKGNEVNRYKVRTIPCR